MEEVFPNIFMITETGTMGALMPPVNLYVIAGHDGLMFDTGYGRRASLAPRATGLERIETVVTGRGQSFHVRRALPSHTHPDHFSGLRFLKKRFGTRSVLTAAMAANMKPKKLYYQGAVNRRFRTSRGKDLLARLVVRHFQPRLLGSTLERDPDFIIPDETTLFINDEPWQVMPAPGHCDDHIFLYNEDRGILFSGDNIMRRITTWLGPPRSNLDDYQATLRRVLDLPRLELILSAHGSPVTRPRERIKSLLEHRRQRTEDVLTVIRRAGRSGITPGGIVNRLYTGSESQKRFFADGWIMLTLEKLETEGQIFVRRNRIFTK